MAYQNIPVPFGGYNFCKFSASGLLKCESQSLIFSASDFETNTGDTIPYVAESETEPSDGVILLSAYMGRPPIFSVYKYVSGVLERIHYTSSGLSFSNGFKFVMAISDDDNEPYTIVGLVLPDGSDHTTFFKFSDEYSHMKEYLIPPITYTWQSVAGVSGKGQTYSLSQIATASINNGESVTGASASAFTSLTAQVSTMVTDDSAMSGADAGGISGSGSNSGDQSSGYAFGQGESGTNVSGGGGGYYGGEKGGSLLSGGAGSGYIGNSLVSNKKMVGYNVPTSSAESTKTESVSVYSATKEANKPKAGNGFARIKLVQSAQQKVDISASNQLKNNGVSPTVIMGTLGEYDSQTQSYYFSDVCSFSYSNAVISKSELLNAKRLYLEMEIRLDNASVGINIDATIHIRYGTDGYRILGVVAGNGESGTGDYSFFWMNNGTVQKNDTAPLDVSANRGAFHKVKFELLMNNGTVTTMNCYLDGELYKTKSVNEAFVLDYDEYNIYCDIIKYAYVKTYKVEVI